MQQLTGSFTVTKAVFGAGGYVQNFDATFEQHCEDGSTAARGEVHISNAPAQPATSAVAPNPATTRATTATTQPRTTNTPAGAQPGITGTPAGAQPSMTGTPSATRNESSTLAGIVRAPLLMLGLGLIGWFVLVAFGLVTVGVDGGPAPVTRAQSLARSDVSGANRPRRTGTERERPCEGCCRRPEL